MSPDAAAGQSFRWPHVAVAPPFNKPHTGNKGLLPYLPYVGEHCCTLAQYPEGQARTLDVFDNDRKKRDS